MTLDVDCRCNREDRHRGLCNRRATIAGLSSYPEAEVHKTAIAMGMPLSSIAIGEHWPQLVSCCRSPSLLAHVDSGSGQQTCGNSKDGAHAICAHACNLLTCMEFVEKGLAPQAKPLDASGADIQYMS